MVRSVVWGGMALVIAGVSYAYFHSKLKGPGLPKPTLALSHFSLTNQVGEVVVLEAIRGKISVFDVIFTTCPGPCLRMSELMAELAEEFKGDPEVQFVSLTAHPSYDTEAVLKAYADRFNAQAPHWRFLTGEKEEIYSLAIEGLKLTVMAKPEDGRTSYNDLFIHSTMFVLVDREARVRAWIESDRATAKNDLMQAIQGLKTEK